MVSEGGKTVDHCDAQDFRGTPRTLSLYAGAIVILVRRGYRTIAKIDVGLS